MTVHELATNAAKHGALSRQSGRVAIAWRTAGERLTLRWAESGGPPVEPPVRRGFGASLLSRALEPLGGETRLDWARGGLVCEMTLGLSEAVAPAPDPVALQTA
jgi:two-component sensor histidine kinase